MKKLNQKTKFQMGYGITLLAAAALPLIISMIGIFPTVKNYSTTLEYNTSVFEQFRNFMWTLFFLTGLLALVGIGMTLRNCIFRDQGGLVQRNFFDRIPPEVHLCTMTLAGVCYIPIIIATLGAYLKWPALTHLLRSDAKSIYAVINVDYANDYWFDPKWMPVPALMLLMAIAGAICGMVILTGLIAYLRNILNHTFLKSTILGRLIPKLENIINRSNSFQTVILIALILLCFLSASLAGAGVVISIALIVVLVPKYYQKYNEVKKGIHAAASGNFEYRIDLPGKGEFENLAREVNAISEAKEKAIQSEMRSQRMKTELITNVSHDLRTPLTSIITYVDLLKKENLESESAREYVEILDNKSKRFQNLVDSLFDAAKASSGDIPVEWMYLDMGTLTEQAIGEFTDDFQQKNLKLIQNIPAEPAPIYADGKLTFRILENILGNVKKYAMEGSRVYVDLESSVKEIIFTVKNISEAPLNISAEELMERFVRGDDSRNTEGSGLGLSIAGNLAEIMGGNFRVEIDGDLFKSVLTLPRKEEEE